MIISGEQSCVVLVARVHLLAAECRDKHGPALLHLSFDSDWLSGMSVWAPACTCLSARECDEPPNISYLFNTQHLPLKARAQTAEGTMPRSFLVKKHLTNKKPDYGVLDSKKHGGLFSDSTFICCMVSIRAW